jgi:hypothetical protein
MAALTADFLAKQTITYFRNRRLMGSVGFGGRDHQPDVFHVQELLRRHGFYKGKVDGLCRAHTRRAILWVQRCLKMQNPDGRIDPGGKTWAALVSQQTIHPQMAPQPALNEAPLSQSTAEGTGDANTIFIKRIQEINVPGFPQSTISEFRLGHKKGTRDGYMLECKGPSTSSGGLRQRIPTGTYRVVNHTTGKKGGHGYPKLYNNDSSSGTPILLEGRAILIHPGNWVGDTDGCFLPGRTREWQSEKPDNHPNDANYTGEKVSPSGDVWKIIKQWILQRGYGSVRVVVTEEWAYSVKTKSIAGTGV